MAEASDAAGPAQKRPLYRSLYFQVLIAITIGIALGHYAPEEAVRWQPVATAFVALIKMMIAPIIFCTVVGGIAGMESMKTAGRTGLYALLYFEVVTTFALAVGLIIVNVVQPGTGMHVEVASLDVKPVAVFMQAGEAQTVSDFLLHLIPGTFFEAFATGNILQVLVVSILFGVA